jgi:transaldolase
MMRIFINSADTSELHTALTSGYVYGVTTNPTILRQASVSARQVSALTQQMIDWGAREVHLQTYAETASNITSEGRMLSAINAERVVVRVPATPAGFAAARQLIDQGARVSMTAVYTMRQVLLSESVGASYVVVYLGRMRDTGLDGMTQISQMQQLLAAQRAQVRMMVGSVREVSQFETLAMQGISAATVPAFVLENLVESPATASAASGFRADAEAILDQPGSIGGH